MIRLVDVRKSFGSRVILDGLSLDVREGETFVLIGPSGTGKSVTLKHIVGLLQPDSGEVYVDDEPVHTATPPQLLAIRRKMGFLFQNGALLASMNVTENVALPLRQHTDWPEEKIRAAVEEKLGLVDMEGRGDVMPSDLSGGMRKRVSLARAIIMSPRIVLYDEPTSGLDPVMSNVINKLINGMKTRLGITSIVVTHDMASAYLIADRIGMIFKGKLVESGAPKDLLKTTNPIVRQFIDGKTEGPLTAEEVTARPKGPAARVR